MPVIPIDRLPALYVTDAPPIPVSAHATIARIREEIDLHPAWFDAPHWMVTSADTDVIVCHPSRFSHLRAQLEHPELGLGCVSIRVLVHRGGRYLWTRRSAHVTAPGEWALGAAGLVDPGKRMWDAVWAEMREEIGLGPRDCRTIAPLALMHGPDTAPGAGLLFHADLTPEAVITPDPAEVSEVRWAGLHWRPEGVIWADTGHVLKALETLGWPHTALAPAQG